MKDFFKTHAYLVALLVGAICYWSWAQVSNLREQTALLHQEKTALIQVLSNQCTDFLAGQRMQVVPMPPVEDPSAGQESDDGEDPR